MKQSTSGRQEKEGLAKVTLHSALGTGYLNMRVLGPTLGAVPTTLETEGSRPQPGFIPKSL